MILINVLPAEIVYRTGTPQGMNHNQNVKPLVWAGSFQNLLYFLFARNFLSFFLNREGFDLPGRVVK